MRLTRLNELVRGPETFEGSWALTRRHELQYRRQGREEEVILRGPIVGVEPNGLSFRVAGQSVDGDLLSRRLTLTGRWQADPENRLTFGVERQKGGRDWLKLEAGWEVGPGHQILVRLREEELKSGPKRTALLRFSGFWEVGEGRRLTYVLDRESGSAFRFRGAFQTGSILAKEGQIRYQLGAEAAGRGEVQTVTLFGKWKVSRRLDLAFEIPYRDGQAQGLDFEAAFSTDPDGNVAARLRTEGGRPVGVEVLFTREFLKGDAQLFARIRREVGETAVEGGVRLRW